MQESVMKSDKSSSAARAAETAMVAVGGNGSADVESSVSVDKIRDLLFGNQMQDYDRRFAQLEERFQQRLKEIESEAARNLSAFESNSKKQVDSLAGQLRDEKEQRADGDKEIERKEADGVARSSAPRRKRPAHRCRQGDRADPARAQ